MTTVLRLFVTLLEGESEGEVYRHRFVRPSQNLVRQITLKLLLPFKSNLVHR